VATSEHYFQAKKFAGTVHEESVRTASTAREAAAMGRDRTLPMRSDWEEAKVNVMRVALRFKFDAQPVLINLLLSTGDQEIIEQTTDDHYWGCGSRGDGLNMLGKLLMELRNAYRTAQSVSS